MYVVIWIGTSPHACHCSAINFKNPHAIVLAKSYIDVISCTHRSVRVFIVDSCHREPYLLEVERSSIDLGNLYVVIRSPGFPDKEDI